MIYNFQFKILQLFCHAVQEIVRGVTLFILDTENKSRLCPLEINIL